MEMPLWVARVRADLVRKELIPIKILFLCIYGGSNALFPFLTLHARSLGITEWELGVVYGFNPVIALIGPPMTGIVADKIGNFKVMLSATVGASGFAALLFLAVPLGHVTHPLPPALSLVLEAPSAATLVLPHPLSCQLRPNLSLSLTNCTTTNTTAAAACSRWGEIESELFVLEGEVVPREDNTSSSLHLANSTFISTPFNFNSTLILHMMASNVNGTGKEEADDVRWSSEGHQQECSVHCQASSAALCSNTATVLHLDSSLTFWCYFFVRVLNTLTLATSMTLFDGATMAILKEHGGEYGLQRVYATLGIVILTPVSGSLIDYVSYLTQQENYNSAFFLYFGLKIIAAVVILLVNLDFREASNRVLHDLRFLMRQPVIMAFLIVMLITGTSFGLLDTFLFWLLQDLGATRMLMGLTVAVGGVAGIPLLVAANGVITRLGHANTIVISTAFYIVRFVGYSFLTSAWWCMPLEALECMTVALLSTTAVSYAAVLATPATLATLQGMYGGMHYGVGRGMGSLLGGFLLGPLGIRSTFRMMAAVCAVTCVLYFLANRFLFPRLHRPSVNDTQGLGGKDQPNADGQIQGRDVQGKKKQKTELTRREGQEKKLEEVEGQSIAVEGIEGQEKNVQESEGQRKEMDRRDGFNIEVEDSEGQEKYVKSCEGQEKEAVESERDETRVKGRDKPVTEYERKVTDEETGDVIRHVAGKDKSKSDKDSRHKDGGSGVKGNVRSSSREKDESEQGKAQENLAFEDDE